MDNFLAIEIPTWAATVLSLFAAGGIGFYFVQRVVERKKFQNEDKFQESNINKSNAEIEKVKAEAYETNTKANSVVVKIATEMAERLSKECDNTKQELREQGVILDAAQNDLNSLKDSLKDALSKITILQSQLIKERTINSECAEKNLLMQTHLEELTEQLNKLKS
jgi:septation ring formation regulator EzrA